jgi:hypothetical protein
VEQNQTARQGLGVDIKNPVQVMFASMNRAERRQFLAEHAKRRATWPKRMQADPAVPPDMLESGKVLGAWKSRDFSCVAWSSSSPNIMCRLSINRLDLDNEGNWLGGISWDDLFRIKNECGFGDCDAVEVYPAEDKLVNVSNVRHLWVFANRLNFGLV